MLKQARIQPYTTQIRLIINNHFNLEELKTLAFDLQIDYDEIAGETKSSKSRELIALLQRQGKLKDLVEIASRNRPNVVWPDPSMAVEDCPYQGLSAFQEANAEYFFGQTSFITRLYNSVNQNKLTAVIGPSGSGKSSVVFAGLIPQLRRENNWLIEWLRPGRRPFYALATALIALINPSMSAIDKLIEIPKLASALENNTLPLADIFGLIRQRNQAVKHFLLIIDQFEELYTLCPDTKTRQFFIDTLINGLNTLPDQTNGIKPTILITLRADFLGQVLLNRTLADTLQDNDLKLRAMNREELESVIIRPAALCNVAFEAGLVSRILDDLNTAPPSRDGETNSNLALERLPLLEFALTLLWEWQSKNQLTHSGYEAIGKVDGALASYADEIYSQMNESNQARMKKVMIQMVQPGVSTQDSRRLATKEEMTKKDWNLVQALADARLVVTTQGTKGQETAEIIHEALIQHWKRLREWMVAERAFRTWQERLRGNIHQWQTNEQDEGTLLRGIPLVEAENWLIERHNELGKIEISYIQKCLDERERNKKEQEKQRQRELLAAQKLAKTERERAEEQLRSATKLRRFTYYILVAFALALFTTIAAVFFGIDSQNQKSTAIAALETTEAIALAQVNDAQLYQEIAIQARETANALSPSTPLPSLGPPMVGEINIAVAKFSVLEGGAMDTESGQQIAELLFLEFEEYNQQSPTVLSLELRGPTQLLAIDGQNVLERTESADKLASQINADIVFYGSIESFIDTFVIRPEYYVDDNLFTNNYLLVDMLGQSGLGEPFNTPLFNSTDSTDSPEELQTLYDRTIVVTDLVIGFAYYDMGLYEDALSSFTHADSISTWQPNQKKEALYTIMGTTANAIGTYDLAENYMVKALAINSQYAPTYLALGELYYLQAFDEGGDEDSINMAIDAYESAISAIDRPTNSDVDTRANFGLGQSYLVLSLYNEGSYEQAMSAFASVIEDYEAGNERVKETAAEAHARLGLIYIQIGAFEKALEEYHAAIELTEIPNRREIFEDRLREIESTTD